MTDPWPRTQTLVATRSAMLQPGAVADGFRGRGVQLDGEELLVTFRWWSDPNTYGVRFELPAVPADSPWTGLPVQSADQWAADVAGWLMEELQTGLVRRVGRRDVAGVVELDPDRQRGWDITGWYVSTTGWVTPARAALAMAATGVGPVRSAHLLAGGRLISWLHAHVDNITGSPTVGQAAVGWVTSPAGPARLDLLTVDPDVPVSVGRMLAHHAVHDAAEAGATEVTTTLEHPWLHDVGFRPDPAGPGLVLDTTRLGPSRPRTSNRPDDVDQVLVARAHGGSATATGSAPWNQRSGVTLSGPGCLFVGSSALVPGGDQRVDDPAAEVDRWGESSRP